MPFNLSRTAVLVKGGPEKQMLDEANKNEEQDQSGVPTAPAEVPQVTDADNGVSPPLSGASGVEDQVQPQGTGCDSARAQDGVHHAVPEGAVGSDSPDTNPDAQSEGDHVLSGPGQTEQKPVSADGTHTSQQEVSPEIDDPFTVSYESEEEKRAVARVIASYHPYPYLPFEDIAEPEEGSDGPDPTPESTIWPEYDEYEPTPTLEIIRRAGQIDVVRVEWRGLRPILTVVNDRYSPPSMPSAVYSSIRLANDVAEYQSAREVFDAVYEVLQKCSALSRYQCEVLTFWSIASWFQDALDFLPHVTISGPLHMAQLLFSLLEYVCHKPLKLIDMNLAALKGISMEQLKPTLLVHQVKAGQAATHLLQATDYPGYFVANRDGLYMFYCAKVVYIGETCPKQTRGGLHIHLGRNAPVPVRPYRSSAAIERLQSRLLSYRAFNRERADFLEVAPGELQPEFDLIARRLGAVIINDSALQRRLVELLKGWSEDVRAERAGGIDGAVLTAVLNFAHGNDRQPYVREIAVATNEIRFEQGEPSKLSCEKIGHLLRKLGLHTHRDMNGRKLVFDQSTQLLVHQLCFEYDVLPAAPECGYCHKLQTAESE